MGWKGHRKYVSRWGVWGKGQRKNVMRWREKGQWKHLEDGNKQGQQKDVRGWERKGTAKECKRMGTKRDSERM
jgi:hypothetical protein